MKQKSKGKACAIAVMVACILISLPLGVHTTMDRKDDAAIEAFYESTANLLAANAALGENIVRNSKVLLDDFAGDANIAELREAQQAMSNAYDTYARAMRKEPSGRADAAALVRAYNEFSGPVLRWLALADEAIEQLDGNYGTFETFRDKFLNNHASIFGGQYNTLAEIYNRNFEEPMVGALGWASFTGMLPLFEDTGSL